MNRASTLSLSRTCRDGCRAIVVVEMFMLLTLSLGRLMSEEEYHSGDFRSPESCAECHPRHYQEWRGSAHAYSMVDPVVQACIRLAEAETDGKVGSRCIGCHAPIGARTGELKPDFKTLEGAPRVISAGVSCTVCHRMRPPDAGDKIGNASFELKPGDVYYGRLYRPVRTPAHGSDRSDFMGSSVLCGSCHDVLGEKGPLEKTYFEWSKSIHRERDTQCQDCHMLRYSGQAAVGGPFRDTLHRHNFPAVTLPLIRFPNRGYQMEEVQRFLRTAARMDVIAPPAAVVGKTFRLVINVKNSGAGHNLPSGISALRQMWLEVTARDSQGRTLFRSGHLDANGDLMDHHSADDAKDPALVNFADRFLDANGKQVFFFWQADSVDERSLKPLEERSLRYGFPLRAGSANEAPLRVGDHLSVQVRLLFRPLPPYILRHLGLGKLVDKLPLWEMDAVRFDAIPVVEVEPPRTIRVPLEIEGIQAAINASRDGDTILVAPGEYTIRTPLNFQGKAITVRSAAGRTRTTVRLHEPLDADRASVVVFQSGETDASRLEGFTLAGGAGTMEDGFRRGGGILITGSPSIVDNQIEECSAQGGVGGGICIDGGTPTVRGNVVHSCVAERGGGIAIRSSQRVGKERRFDSNLIHGNVARVGGGIYIENRTAVTLERCLIVGNIALVDGGGCFAADHAAVEAGNLTVTRNRADHAGGGIAGAATSSLSVTHSIFWENDPDDGAASYSYTILSAEPTAATATATATNLSRLPLFRDPSGFWEGEAIAPSRPGQIALPGRWKGGDYHLLPGSPAVDAGDPLAVPDPDDTRRDLGALFHEQPRKAFIRGDVDGNGKIAWNDLLALSRHFLSPAETTSCQDAADVDDSGRITVADAARLGFYLMTGKAAPEAPYPECGPDPTFAEGLSCDQKGEPCQGVGTR